MDVVGLHRAWLAALDWWLSRECRFGVDCAETTRLYQQAVWALQSPCSG